jgi:putative ABC transport system ATP-binding protein
VRTIAAPVISTGSPDQTLPCSATDERPPPVPHCTYVTMSSLLLKLSESDRKAAMMEAIEHVGLASKVRSRPAQLSGGECQRVAIARAMVKKPELVLADEPTANLDAENSHHILQTMARLNRELATTFIFSTHDDKVIRYLRRKITLEDGRVASDETMTPTGEKD